MQVRISHPHIRQGAVLNAVVLRAVAADLAVESAAFFVAVPQQTHGVQNAIKLRHHLLAVKEMRSIRDTLTRCPPDMDVPRTSTERFLRGRRRSEERRVGKAGRGRAGRWSVKREGRRES